MWQKTFEGPAVGLWCSVLCSVGSVVVQSMSKNKEPPPSGAEPSDSSDFFFFVSFTGSFLLRVFIKTREECFSFSMFFVTALWIL